MSSQHNSWFCGVLVLLGLVAMGCGQQPTPQDQTKPPAVPTLGKDADRPRKVLLPITPGKPRIRLVGKKEPFVEILPLSSQEKQALGVLANKPKQLQKVFALYVQKPGSKLEEQPAVLGTLQVQQDCLRFRPRFPLVPGVRYRAVYHPQVVLGKAAKEMKPFEVTLHIPRTRPTQATTVQQVYPTADTLPENQLKFYIHFSAPMSQGNVYRHIHLLDGKGKEVKSPFLTLGEELWDPAGKRFTLLFNPGRIKRGLKPREELGPALLEGKRYTLVIDSRWEDAQGFQLAQTFRKSFRVAAPDDVSPDPSKWKVVAPRAGQSKPLLVHFPEPMDHALLHRFLIVTDARGRELSGKVTVTDHEKRWQFVPEKPWRVGMYQLLADTRLEDLAANSIERPFEVDVFRKVERKIKSRRIKIPFAVREGKKRRDTRK